MIESSKLWTRPFIAILMMAFLFFLSLQILTAGFPAFISDMKNNPAQGGLMTTAFMVAAIITRPLIGMLIHKVHMKMLIIVAILFIIFTVGLSYQQESVSYLLLLRILHGIGFGVISTVIATMATNIIPSKRIGEGVGYYGLATSIGTSLAPMFALAFLQIFSFDALLVLSVLLAIATLILSLFIKQTSSSSSSNTVKQQVSLKEYAFDKKALLPCLLTAFFSITLGGVISFLSELGKEADLGGSVSMFFLIIALVMMFVRPFSGRLFDRKGHKVIMFPATLCGIIGLFLLAITQETWTLLLAGLFYGIAYGTIAPTLQSLAVSFVSKEKQGTANAMYLSFMDLGMAIGSTGLGILASITGYHMMYGFSIGSLVLLLLIYTFTFWKPKHANNVPNKAS
ncbi:MFS transporter [Risungbinella massiliensis]|uniref:MFS transporter n=1 Tax=Risungbinella massiliensis TaxID=1329796 RepID=UPI0005CC7832|nr:MFS transporter [Risungbinella massiliensis]